MSYSPKLKVEIPRDQPEWAHSLLAQLQTEFKNVSIAQKQGGTTVVISGTSTTSSSSSSSTSSSNVKAGIGSVIANTSAWITFPAVFTTAPIVTMCFIAGTDGSFGTVNSQSLTVSATGFQIPASEVLVSGNIFYIAVSS